FVQENVPRSARTADLEARIDAFEGLLRGGVPVPNESATRFGGWRWLRRLLSLGHRSEQQQPDDGDATPPGHRHRHLTDARRRRVSRDALPGVGHLESERILRNPESPVRPDVAARVTSPVISPA